MNNGNKDDKGDCYYYDYIDHREEGEENQ